MNNIVIADQRFNEIMNTKPNVKDENQPVVWKGPLISNTVKQFY